MKLEEKYTMLLLLRWVATYEESFKLCENVTVPSLKTVDDGHVS